MPRNSNWELPPIRIGASREVGVESLHPAIVEREHVVASRFDHEEALELLELLGHLLGEVVCLGPVVGRVQLPQVLR